MNTEKLVSLCKFPEKLQQEKIFNYLKSKDEDKNLDSSKRTLFLRSTGDNFRAAARFPTEQTSYAILNITDLANNPYGQFISTLWRGQENRETVKTHVSAHYEELKEAVINGITLTLNENEEHFNVVVLLVADLSFVKDIVGQCSSISMYGCYHCKLPSKDWILPLKKVGKEKKVCEMVKDGKLGFDTLGDNPNHDSPEFKKFQQSHYGQWVMCIFHFLYGKVLTIYLMYSSRFLKQCTLY